LWQNSYEIFRFLFKKKHKIFDRSGYALLSKSVCKVKLKMAAVTIEGLKWDRLRCGDSARTSLEECDAAAGHRVVFSVFSCVRNKNSLNTYKYGTYTYSKIFS
jgi:hypothetical protein